MNNPSHNALEFLKHRHMGILSTVSADGKPWGSAINYIVDDDFTFYFVTRAETYKYQNLEANPYVALTIADEASQTTVQLSGEVSPLPHEDYLEVVFKRMPQIRPAGDMQWMPPVEKLHKGNYMPLVLKPAKLQYADYKQYRSDIHGEYIEHII